MHDFTRFLSASFVVGCFSILMWVASVAKKSIDRIPSAEKTTSFAEIFAPRVDVTPTNAWGQYECEVMEYADGKVTFDCGDDVFTILIPTPTQEPTGNITWADNYQGGK